VAKKPKTTAVSGFTFAHLPSFIAGMFQGGVAWQFEELLTSRIVVIFCLGEMINKSIKYHGVSEKALAVVEHPLLDARQGVYLTTASSRWALARSLEFGGQNTNFYGCFLVTSHSRDRTIPATAEIPCVIAQMVCISELFWVSNFPPT